MNSRTIDQADPYYVCDTRSHGQGRIYEYSAYARYLGPDFVARVCANAREETTRLKAAGDKLFVAKAVYPLEILFSVLHAVLNKNGVASVSEMKPGDWETFAAQSCASIECKPNHSSVTIKNAVSKWKSALDRFSKAGLIPQEFNSSDTALSDGPYFVFQNKVSSGATKKGRPIVYEYSGLANKIGEEFLASACTLVKRLRHTSGVNEKTWQDNYANRFNHFVHELHTFLISENHASAPTLTEDEWQRFVDRYGEYIQSERLLGKGGKPSSAKTKDKIRFLFNNLMAHFAVAGLLPKRFEINPAKGRNKAVDGSSKLTNRGWAKKAKEDFPFSPYGFMCEGHNRKKPYEYGEFQPLARWLLLTAIPILKKDYEAGSEGRAKKKHQALTSWFTFLQQQKECGVHPEFFAALESDAYQVIDSLTWEKINYEWRDRLIHHSPDNKKNTAAITKHGLIKTMNGLWQMLASYSVVPCITLKGIKNAKNTQRQRGRPSLAQLSPRDEAATGLSAEDQKTITDKLTQYFDNDEKPEAVEFINALCANLTPDKVRSLTLDSLIIEICNLNATRLETLRKCAEHDFLYWYDHWQAGQRAIAKASHSQEEIVDLLDNPYRSVSERRRNSTKLLSGVSEQHLGNTLNLLIEAVDGNVSGIGGRYHHIGRRWGGSERLHAYIHPHKRATLALWVLALLDTGANTEVVREMPADCLVPTEDPRYMVVFLGVKARSGYKRIKDCLETEPQPHEKISVIQAIEKYQLMSTRYRQRADDNTARLLFLDTRNDKIVGITEFRARDDFKQFLLDHPELENLNVRPSFIRPSYLLRLQHGDPQAPMELAQAHADHASSTTTKTYTLRAHTKLVYAQKIRDFTRQFQIVIIASIEGAAEKLGISSQEASRLFSDAARSGLGVACLNSKAGIQPGTFAGEHCTRLDACPSCDMHYLVGTVENIADMILFGDYLRSREEEAMKANPIGWEQRWFPWIALIEVALAKFSQGETASAFVQARQKAEERRLTYKPFPLF